MKHRMHANARRRRSGGWLRDDAGAAAVEFAIVLPVVLLILFGTIEFGRAWNVRQTLTDAAREGARVAAVANGIVTPTSKLQDSVQTIIRGAATNARLDLTKLTVGPHTGIGGATGSPVTINVEYQYQPLFGTWVLPSSVFEMRTASVMRNE